MRRPFGLLMILGALLISVGAANARGDDSASNKTDRDLLLKTRVGVVDVELFIPKESRPVQGVLAHVFNYQMRENDRWATLCRELKWAHINTVISRKENNRPQKIRNAIEVALKQFGEETDLPELVHVPRTGTGFSAGGMVVSVLAEEPEKMLTNAISCSWVKDPASLGGGAAIPQLFIIGAVPDGFKMLPAIEKFYEPAMAAKRPWALGLQHECRHDWANSGTLGVAWIQAIAALRYPEQIDETRPIPLRSVSFQDGWIGDRSTINGVFATVLPASEFQGDLKNAVWLPDRATAWVWRAWQVKNGPIDLTMRTSDGKTRLPAFQPKKSFGMTVAPHAKLVLGMNVKKDASSPLMESVKYFHGDQLIGETRAAPWEIEWSPRQIGCYAVWAQATGGGKTVATNPALICLEPSR